MQSVAAFLDASPGRYVLRNSRIPNALLAPRHRQACPDQTARVRLTVEDGVILAIEPETPPLPRGASGDLGGAWVWPTLTDLHTHLDKTATAPRIPETDSTLLGAVKATMADRCHWQAVEMRARAEFALKCAWVHGTSALRTHLDSVGPQSAVSWGVLGQLQKDWAGRIALQGVAMVPIEFYLSQDARALVERVAAQRGVLGGVTRVVSVTGEAAAQRCRDALQAMFRFARDFDLDVDLHVDESGNPRDRSLEAVAEQAEAFNWGSRVVCGHCCSLSTQTPAEQARILQRCKAAGLTVVSLPLINTFLQDRQAHSTPQWRGLPPLHRMKALGIPVALASDNCRDAFHPYGDYDLLEVLRESMRTGHLDLNAMDWLGSISTTPAACMGAKMGGVLEAGGPADFIIFNARSLSELFARPQADRIVVRSGKRLTEALPAFSELDSVFDQGC